MAEFDRAIGELGLHGVATTSQFRGLPLDSEQLYPFYEKVSALDVPIFVHPAMVPEGYGLLMDYDLARILGREVDLAVAATRIVAGGVLERFPNLKFVIGHFGGGIAGVKDRLVAKAYRFGTLDKPFEHYFDMLYFDMAGFEGAPPPWAVRFRASGPTGWCSPPTTPGLHRGSAPTRARA